jgi:exonuclease I
LPVTNTPPSFLFFDLETTGADPAFDRPLQFAAIRTDMALEPIGEPVVWYARVPEDCLPHPAAVMTTGILPDAPELVGADSEASLANRIHRLVSQPNTCVVGFNNLRFDAPMLRFLFWRNLLDPYRHEWADGNSRFDVLDAARDKRQVARLIDSPDHAPFLHVSPRLPARVASASMFCSFGQVDGNRNRRECWDLRFDPLPWLDLDADGWAERRFLKNPPEDAERDWDDLRLPVKSIHLNRVPVVLPAETLDHDGVAQRMVVDRERIALHAERFREHFAALRERLVGALEQTEGDFPPQPVEQALYAGFVPPGDRRSLEAWWARARSLRSRSDAIEHARSLLSERFEDDRLPELVEGFVARNLPEALDAEARGRWRSRLAEQLRPGGRAAPDSASRRDFPGLRAEVDRLEQDENWSVEQRVLLAPYRRWLAKQERELETLAPGGQKVG